MSILKSIVTREHGTFTSKIDEKLQKCNPLTARGIFLVNVENGVVWGYDKEKYELDESNAIVRKKSSDAIDKKYV